MLIICENFDGMTPARAVPWYIAWQRFDGRIQYVTWGGNEWLAAGVYRQRYQLAFEFGPQIRYTANRLERNDFVCEVVDAANL